MKVWENEINDIAEDNGGYGSFVDSVGSEDAVFTPSNAGIKITFQDNPIRVETWRKRHGKYKY